ncbi:hypothetical protein ACSVC9_12005 [Clostridium sp. LBM24168]
MENNRNNGVEKKNYDISELIKKIKDNTEIVQVIIDKGMIYVPVYYSVSVHKKYFKIYDKYKDCRKAFCGLVLAMINNNMAQIDQVVKNTSLNDIEKFDDRYLIKILEVTVKQSDDLTEYYNKNITDNYFERFYRAIEYEKDKYTKHLKNMSKKFWGINSILNSSYKYLFNNHTKINELYNYKNKFLKGNYSGFAKYTKLMPKYNYIAKSAISNINMGYLNDTWMKYSSNYAIKNINYVQKKFVNYNLARLYNNTARSILANISNPYISHVLSKNIVANIGNIEITDSDINILNKYELSEKEILETQNVVSDIFNESMQQKINDRWELFACKNPLIAKFLKLVIESIMGILIVAIISNGYHVIKTTIDSKNINKNNSEELKIIKKDISTKVKNQFYGNENIIFNYYRYIISDKACIRTGRYMHSYSIMKFHKGDFVQIIKKDKHWCYIEYISEDDNAIRGWVNTIYTRRFD